MIPWPGSQCAGQSLLVLAPTTVAAVHDADAMMVVTDWDEFWTPEINRFKAVLFNPVIFDA
ncbi:MAG: hypothetical protein Q7T36_06985 [Fluviicoccus sp.]|uniref:hypothetical protein n=1 Tax=Fluviicoccus sp. TaxID=2003552 RepID=UPI0027255516|nr:hypothetical protein [Fluviicoccus sp.]MDO8330197.1 hypothetical protein [Fluviicoccus sp.]